MMNNALSLILAALGGAVGGAFFFGGLWWTIRRGLPSENPALWFLGSLLLRTAVVAGGFLWIAQRDWARALACLLGFWSMRAIMQVVSRQPSNRKSIHP